MNFLVPCIVKLLPCLCVAAVLSALVLRPAKLDADRKPARRASVDLFSFCVLVALFFRAIFPLTLFVEDESFSQLSVVGVGSLQVVAISVALAATMIGTPMVWLAATRSLNAYGVRNTARRFLYTSVCVPATLWSTVVCAFALFNYLTSYRFAQEGAHAADLFWVCVSIAMLPLLYVLSRWCVNAKETSF